MGMMSKFVWVASLTVILLQWWCCEGCLKRERDALLHLKTTFTNRYLNYFNLNWVDGTDCCQWNRVDCNTTTRRVENLTLDEVWFRDSYLNFSDFLAFEHLKGLDLSLNNIAGCVELKGSKNLTLKLNNLEVLYLSLNQLNDSGVLSCLSWLSLSSLKSLYLDQNNLTAKSIHGLSSTFINLEDLSLSGNFSDIDIASSLSGLSSLKSLAITYSHLTSKSMESFSKLRSLKYLDLIGNNMTDNMLLSIDNKSSLWPTNLEVLGLSSNKFSNKILSSFGGLQRLKSLDIRDNQLEGLTDISELSALKNLEILDVSNNNITDFVVHKGIKCLSSVKELSLRSLNIEGSKLRKSLKVFSPIRMLDLSNNEFKGRKVIAADFGELHNLEQLSLDGSSNIGNEFFESIGALTSLKVLNMEGCAINGTLPSAGWSKLNKLEELELSFNNFVGPLPSSFGNMTSLESLYFQGNQFEVPVSFSIFANHSNLKSIYGSGQLIPDPCPTSQTWVPKFQLQSFALDVITTAGSLQLPRFLFYQYNLTYMSLTGWNFNTNFPIWLLENNTKLTEFVLSNCSSTGNFQLPLHPMSNIWKIDTSDNNITGQLPSSNYTSIFPNLQVLILSSNAISGEVPHEFGQMKSLDILDLSQNCFTGSIPIDLVKHGNLEYLDLSKNNLSGFVPSFYKSATLEFINLSKNRLSGLDTTRKFNESSNIVKILDLSYNGITGGIQDLIGNVNSTTLQVLLLKGNHFLGQIPIQLCQFTYLTIIDVSNNNIFGPLPNCLGSIHFKSDGEIGHFELESNNGDDSFYLLQQIAITKKNRFDTYKGQILDYTFVLDLSCNMLMGNIPSNLGNLTSIQSINLSHNHFTGPIPTSFSDLKFLESLDLSFNMLSSEIPPQLTELTSLEVFSVAHNNLSGVTPERKNQFMTFDESSYEGNPFLCGPPLHSCTIVIGQPNESDSTGGNDNGFLDVDVFYISFVVSYTSTLLALTAVLCINPHWRRSWLNYIEVFITNCCYFILDNSCKFFTIKNM